MMVVAGGLVIATAVLASGEARATCDDLVPGKAAVGENGEAASPGSSATAGNSANTGRSVTPEDLIGLRDIGTPDAATLPVESPLAVSPDGARLAFIITRADPHENRICRGLALVDLVPGATARLVDRGGAFLANVYPVRGYLMNPGAPETVTPVWSPDGRSLAYRKRVDGRTEAWIAAADGSGARVVARLPADIEAIAWSEDGARLLVASRPALAEAAAGLDREGLAGFLYDERMQPYNAARPALKGGAARVVQSVGLADGLVGTAGPGDEDRLGADFMKGAAAALSARDTHGRRAWLSRETRSIASALRVNADGVDGRSIACDSAVCSGRIPSLFWLGDEVVFLRREGWADGTYALYRWRPGAVAPRRILATEEAVHGCVAAGGRIVCFVENATSPRRVFSIDAKTGARQVLFDPNPEFRSVRLGAVRRLKVRNALGYEAWGDLVLPPGYRGGRLPMVVVQYHSDGFLRGGTGDDYPVHAFAARGMAVLSFERPRSIGARSPTAASGFDLVAANSRDWGDRRSILDALEAAIAQAVRIGVADPARIGITGLSDGATTTGFALINSRSFAAAAISTCCLEPSMTTIYGGPHYAQVQAAQGYPRLGQEGGAFWAPMSLARNAARIDVPILMQLADREYLTALETWASLKEAGKPVEMHVFPDEHHNKWQPAHRLATYRRSLDWFDYWLAGRRDPDPAKVDQYRRWDGLARKSGG